ncbi:MAG TPA: TlpA disulfide reductase family protein [Candidatus Sulfopaludibacter sp.]|jgi:peroxiredoxin|nr:TlpA disulfide reductase family protein [Candidatus Sulfopaludibacter sp.]
MRKTLAIALSIAAVAAFAAQRRAPGFALPDSKMQVYDLADYRGKIVILEFMQTTCAHCAAFTGVLQQVEQKYGNKVQILSVVKAPEDDSRKVQDFAATHRITYPILFDAGQMAFSYVRSGNLAFPHVYVIDANGDIRSDYVYNQTNRDIFEGKALFTELDRMVAEKK